MKVFGQGLRIISALAVLCSASFAFAVSEFRSGEIIVKYRDGYRRNRMTMEAIYDTAAAVKVKRFKAGNGKFEQLFLENGTDLKKVIAALEKNPAVEYAQPNFIIRALPVDTKLAKRDGGIPCIPGMEVPGCVPLPCLFPGFPPGCDDGGGSKPDPGQPEPPAKDPEVAERPADIDPPVADPDLDKAYGIAKIGATEAWKATRGSQEVIVAVIDTGIDYNHEDLAYNVWRNPQGAEKGLVGWDFVHDDNLPFDDNEHGTHCAGTIGAVGGNGKGVAGVNQRVSIMGLKFLSAEGSGDTAGAIKAIDYAVANGAKVLSNSWGGKGDDDNKGLRDAIQRAEDKGVLFIAAAGNEGTDNDTDSTWPASFAAPNMVVAAATDSKDELAFFSNYGVKTVDLAAPGVDVHSLAPGNRYATHSGTSMACPHVAGAAALVWAAHPNLNYKEVKAKLLESVDKLTVLEGKTATGGRLNVAKAIQ